MQYVASQRAARMGLALHIILWSGIGAPCPASAKDALQFLQQAPPPVFRKGHTLLPLTRWGWTMREDVRVELAARWGYALEFGHADEKWFDLGDTNSVHPRLCALTASDPKRWPLAVLTRRPCLEGDFVKTLPAETWLRDANGEFLLHNGDKVWSPAAPDDVWQLVAAATAEPLREIQKRAPIAIALNGGEYGLGVFGFAPELWAKDPRVVAAKGTNDWFDYHSAAKARQEKIVSDAVKAAAPGALYFFYPTSGSPDRGIYGHYWHWVYDYRPMRVVSDLPNASLYYREHNSGWIGHRDLLTQSLNAVAQQIAAGDPLSYHWVCGGWIPDMFSEPARYTGYLKCLYTAGMVGGIAGYFRMPAGGFEGDLGDTVPSWLEQMMQLSRVHALFSHHEDFLRHGDLLPGPDRHRWSQDLPACEFPTGDPAVRVLARKHRQRATWLITAWAADGPDREVAVEIPELGPIQLTARAAGSVYVATPGQPPELKE
jgi:hypothetical protein